MHLEIIDNKDKGTITVRFLDINSEIPLEDFAKLSLKHLKTKTKMSDLLREYIRENKQRKSPKMP